MLLIVGGSKDHNITRLADAAKARGAEFRLIYTDAEPSPVLSWQPGKSSLVINGEIFEPGTTELFIRYDVFSGNAAKSNATIHARRLFFDMPTSSLEFLDGWLWDLHR